jgi:hypothetical protein
VVQLGLEGQGRRRHGVERQVRPGGPLRGRGVPAPVGGGLPPAPDVLRRVLVPRRQQRGRAQDALPLPAGHAGPQERGRVAMEEEPLRGDAAVRRPHHAHAHGEQLGPHRPQQRHLRVHGADGWRAPLVRGQGRGGVAREDVQLGGHLPSGQQERRGRLREAGLHQGRGEGPRALRRLRGAAPRAVRERHGGRRAVDLRAAGPPRPRAVEGRLPRGPLSRRRGRPLHPQAPGEGRLRVEPPAGS